MDTDPRTQDERLYAFKSNGGDEKDQPMPEEPSVDEESTEVEEDTDQVDTQTSDEETGDTEVEPSKNEIDYKEKFTQSQKGAMELLGKVKDRENLIELLTSKHTPTDEDLSKEFPEWEYASETEKATIRRAVTAERKSNAVLAHLEKEAQQSAALSNAFKFAEDDDRLAGKEAEFVTYASKRTDVPLDVLADAFLYTSRSQTKKTKPILATGTPSGTEARKKDGEKTPEELKELRTKNPERWMEDIRKGRIK